MHILDQHGLTFLDPAANLGVRSLGFRCRIGSRSVVAAYGATGEADLGDGVTLATTVEAVPGLRAVVLCHRLENRGTAPVAVLDAASGCFAPGAAVLHGKGSWLGWDLRYAHTDNLRSERYPHCQMEYPFVRMLPTGRLRLGAGEDQPYPGLWLQDRAGRGGLVIAAASQGLNYLTFDLQKQPMVNDGVFADFALNHDPGRHGGFEIPAGGAIALDGVFMQIVGDLAPEDAFADHLAFLNRTHRFRGRSTPLLAEAFHCTWNYGVFADQNAASLLPTARCIASELPGIRWFLMDAGYLTGDMATTFLDRFYSDPGQFVSPAAWPQGIRGFADEVRRLGLRPGIWWSPTATVPSRLHDEHPDWFLRRADGSLYLIGGKNAFLDYSHPEALAFLDRTLAVILRGWGMDACKMDFWSQNFEDRSARPYDPRLTAVEVRNRFLATVRRHLPDDGAFMTCVATGMGNPFIGQWADAYRNTIDIGVGAWHEQLNNCAWALPTLVHGGRNSFLPNNDSAGIMPAYPDHENLFRLTWCHITMGLLETGGRMERWEPRWIAAMRRLTDRCDRGWRVRCPDDRAWTGVPLPSCLYVDFPPGSATARRGVRQSVALFNWSDEAQEVSVPRARLGHAGAVQAEDFWTGESCLLDGEFLRVRLDGRSARLFDVRA